MKLVRESLSQVIENDKKKLIEHCTPSLEAVEAKVADIGSHLDCEVQAQIALRLRDMVKCAIQCAAEEFGVSNIDAAGWLDWVIEDLRSKGCPDGCVAQLFEVPESDPESSEDPSTKYWRVVYRLPSGIYALAIAKGEESQVEADLKDKHNPQNWTLYLISEDGYKTYAEEGIPDIDMQDEPAAGVEDSRVPSEEEEDPSNTAVDIDELVEESLNVNVDTDQQNVNVAEEDSSVDIRIDSKDCSESECDAEAELQELARDPKYSKAFAYLMKTLQAAEAPSEEDTLAAEDLPEELQENLAQPLSDSPEESSTEGEPKLDEPELETEPPKGGEGNYMASVLGTLIQEEYDAIASYTGLLQDLEANNFGDESDRKVICDILAEENVHVGQLQELLKKVAPTAENIDVGAEEAKTQIEDAEGVKDED